ncbi:MAG: hypothetical protein GF334_02065 [Candidatus Altiarchaeales archaeon]|nr:hypothetical protein [Candidatus Altiarchaeales archaeon]
MQTGYVVPSSLVLRTVSRYASGQHADHYRFVALADFLGIDLFGKTAAQITPEEEQIEKSKERKHRGVDKALTQGFATAVQDMLEDYLPFMYFEDNPEAAKPLQDFYRNAYKAVSNRLPRQIAYALKDKGIEDLSGTSIQMDPETINRIVTDMLLYFRENPEKARDALVKAYSSRQRESDADSTKRGRGTEGVGQAFFQPRMPREQYDAVREKALAEGEKPPQNIDRDLLDALQGRSEVKWEWKGIDENKRLHFTLPEIAGDERVFRVDIPPEIQNIRPGTYTFELSDPTKRGVTVTFKEQQEDIKSDAAKGLEETGIAADQLKRLPDIMVDMYKSQVAYPHMTDEAISKLIEDFGGQMQIRGKLVSDVEDMNELASDTEKKKKKERGGEKAREWTEKAHQERLQKVRQMTERWGPQLAQHFLKADKQQGGRLVHLISSKFPEQVQKGVPSFDATMQTRPIVEIVLRTIMDPDVMPAGGGKRQEWRHIAIDRIKQAAIQDATVRSFFERLGQIERLRAQGAKAPEIKKMLLQEGLQGGESTGAAPLTDSELRTFMDSIPIQTWRKSFDRLNHAISDAMHGMKEEPEIARFFDRARTWRPYVQQQVEEQIAAQLEAQKIPVEKTDEYLQSEEGQKMLSKTKKNVEQQALKNLSKSASQSELVLIRSVLNRLRVA